ncbi:hypothetical protein F511_24814 [Dorcoceras hygrometricum]|uniref:Uncharacterized protein n=1 Tax=Dorcoceras hygrometricum TaxID=472368 RepID=A0A2Z7D8G1_9LAMI|nr:hypothetical protein F511_24814 [Dorcoceras hygrometricum]
MGYVTIAASSCHQRYNQHAAFQLIKTTSPHHQQLVALNNVNDIVLNTSYSLLTADLLTQKLDQTMQQIPHDWYQTQHSKRCVTTKTMSLLTSDCSSTNSWLPSRKRIQCNY